MGVLILTSRISLEFDWSTVYSKGEVEIYADDMSNTVMIDKLLLKTCITKMFMIRRLMTASTSFSEKYELYEWLNVYAYYFYISMYTLIDQIARVVEEDECLQDISEEFKLLRHLTVNFNKSYINSRIDTLLESLLDYLSLPRVKFTCEECVQAIYGRMSDFKFEEYTLRLGDSVPVNSQESLFMRVQGSNLQLWSHRYNWTASVDMLSPVRCGNYLVDHWNISEETRFKELRFKIGVVPILYIIALSRQIGVI